MIEAQFLIVVVGVIIQIGINSGDFGRKLSDTGYAIMQLHDTWKLETIRQPRFMRLLIVYSVYTRPYEWEGFEPET